MGAVIHGKAAAIAATPILSALGMNAVPAIGVWFGGWPPATAMVVYLAETLLIVMVTALRLRLLLPARWDPPAAASSAPTPLTPMLATARWQVRSGKSFSRSRVGMRSQPAMTLQSNQVQTRADLIQSFLILAGGFAAGAGVFLLAITLISRMLDLAATGRVLGPSLLTLSAILLIGLVVDVILLRQASPAQAELWIQQSLGRVFLIYLAVFIGTVLAVFFQAMWFVTPFIVLKTIVDIGGPIQQAIKQVRGVIT